MMRYYVVGTSGCGKSTLGRQMADALNIAHTDLDDIYWGPNWTPRPHDEAVAELNERISEERWVVTGNYSRFQPLIFERMTHVVWLNHSAWTVGRRLLWRTAKRSATRERIFAGNVETFRQSFLSRDSILLWAVKTFRSNRRRYCQLFADLEGTTTVCTELRSQRDVEQWLTKTTEQ